MAVISVEDEAVGFIRETRDTPPSDYLFKIKFSSFPKCGAQKIESSIFKAGGHQWRIVFFPHEWDKDYGDHVSMYLSLARKNSLADGKEVNAIFRLFLFDQIRGKYLSVQGSAKRFDTMKSEWGFSKFLSLKDFKEPTNGFLVKDTCLLGAEVNVRSLRFLECMSIWNAHNVSGNYIWILTCFSELFDEFCYSDEFVAGSYKWRLCMSPKPKAYLGDGLAVFLELVGSSRNTLDEKVTARYSVRLIDQISMEHRTKEGTYVCCPSDHRFSVCPSEATDWFDACSNFRGWRAFIQQKDFEDRTKGFLVNNCCIFEAQVTLLYETYQESVDSLNLLSQSC